MPKRESQYLCTQCNKMRALQLLAETHVKRAQQSSNGLVVYSDIHRCVNGILGINNLQIDANFAARSVEPLELPMERAPMNDAVPAIPSPVQAMKEQTKNISITSIGKENNFRLVIIDNRLKVLINIGEVDIDNENEISSIISDLGTMAIHYYPSNAEYSDTIENWLTLLANILEKLPATRLGLFAETLQYIISLFQTKHDVFHENMLLTILTSHETYFTINIELNEIESSLKTIEAKYGVEAVEIMSKLIDYLETDPLVTLQDYSNTVHHDLVYIISLLLILEQEGVLNIERPGIVEK